MWKTSSRRLGTIKCSENECRETFTNLGKLREHFESDHRVRMVCKDLDFPNFEGMINLLQN